MMCKALLPTILIVLLLTPQQGLSNSLENETVPLNWISLKAICERIQVPFGAMILLLHHENGHIGLASPNTNGTFDFGPFQVNSVHLKSAEFRAAHITYHGLQFNGQVNSLAAAYLFKKALFRAQYELRGASWQNPDVLLRAIGYYHSKTPKYMKRYQDSFIARMKSFKTVKATIAHANKY